MPWPRPAMWVNTGPHEHHDTSQIKKHLQVSLGHLVRRGMRCLGRTAEAAWSQLWVAFSSLPKTTCSQLEQT